MLIMMLARYRQAVEEMRMTRFITLKTISYNPILSGIKAGQEEITLEFHCWWCDR